MTLKKCPSQAKDEKMVRNGISTNRVSWVSLTHDDASQAASDHGVTPQSMETTSPSKLKEAQTKRLCIGTRFSNIIWHTETAKWLLAGSAKEAAVLWNVRWTLLCCLSLKFTLITTVVLSDAWCLNYDCLKGRGRKEGQGTAHKTSVST